jgi:hypothetical protein
MIDTREEASNPIYFIHKLIFCNTNLLKSSQSLKRIIQFEM